MPPCRDPTASTAGHSIQKVLLPGPVVPAASVRSDLIAARTRERHAAIARLLTDGHSVRVTAAVFRLTPLPPD